MSNGRWYHQKSYTAQKYALFSTYDPWETDYFISCSCNGVSSNFTPTKSNFDSSDEKSIQDLLLRAELDIKGSESLNSSQYPHEGAFLHK